MLERSCFCRLFPKTHNNYPNRIQFVLNNDVLVFACLCHQCHLVGVQFVNGDVDGLQRWVVFRNIVGQKL